MKDANVLFGPEMVKVDGPDTKPISFKVALEVEGEVVRVHVSEAEALRLSEELREKYDALAPSRAAEAERKASWNR